MSRNTSSNTEKKLARIYGIFLFVWRHAFSSREYIPMGILLERFLLRVSVSCLKVVLDDSVFLWRSVFTHGVSSISSASLRPLDGIRWTLPASFEFAKIRSFKTFGSLIM